MGKMKYDFKKRIQEGLATLKQGVGIVSLKINEFSAEGKRQYKIFDLQVKRRDQLNALGDLVYDTLKNMRSLDEDKRIRAAFAKIRRIEWQLNKVTGRNKMQIVRHPKTVAKRRVIKGKIKQAEEKESGHKKPKGSDKR